MNAYTRDNDYQEPDELMIPSKDGFIIIPTNSIRVQESSDHEADNNNSKQSSHTLRGILQFNLIPAGMMALLAYIGFSIAGMVGLFVTSAVAGIGFMAISNNRIQKRLRAQPIDSERT